MFASLSLSSYCKMLSLTFLNKLSLNVAFFVTTMFLLVQCDNDVKTFIKKSDPNVINPFAEMTKQVLMYADMIKRAKEAGMKDKAGGNELAINTDFGGIRKRGIFDFLNPMINPIMKAINKEKDEDNESNKTETTTKQGAQGNLTNQLKTEDDIKIETFINKSDDKVIKPFEEISKKAKFFEQMFDDKIKAAKDEGLEDDEQITTQLEGNETEMARMRDDLMAQVKELTALAGEAAQLKNEGDPIVLKLNTEKAQLEIEIKESEKELIKLDEESKANEKLLAEFQEMLKKEQDEVNQAEKEFKDSNENVDKKKNKCIGVREIKTASGGIKKRGFFDFITDAVNGVVKVADAVGDSVEKGADAVVDLVNKGKDEVQSATCQTFNVGAIDKAEHNRDQKRVSFEKEKHDVDVKTAEIAKNREKMSEIEKQNKAANDKIAKGKENIDILTPKLSRINDIQSKLSNHQVKIADLTSKLSAAVKDIKLDLIREGMKTIGDAVND